MLSKLALRNARRSIKDYGIYVMTITIIFSLLYAFNMIIFSEDIMALNKTMDSMIYAIILVSVLIVFVTGWLVHYMNNFILQRRCKEFGTYMLLGISNKAISKLFLLENIIMGLISLVIALIAGSFLYQILTIIIMNIFEAEYRINLSFSIKALALTLLYVILIYSFSLLRTKIKLRKLKIYDLLYAEKKNETMRLKNSKGKWLLLLASIVFGGIGSILIRYNSVTMLTVFEITLCFVLCIYGFYLSLPSILLKLFVDNKRLKYKKDNLFLFRNLSAKINTMSFTLGTLGILLTLTLTSLSAGMLFKGYFDEQIKYISPFDITVTSPRTTEDFSFQKEYVKKNFSIMDEAAYPVYQSATRKIYDLLSGTPFGGSYFEDDTVMKFSDYQKLRKMLGYDEVKLKEGHFLLHCLSGVKNILKKEENFSFTLGKTTLRYQESLTDPFALEGINGAYYVVVIPDKIADKAGELEVRNMVYVADTKEETTAKDYDELVNCNPVKSSNRTISDDLLPIVYVKGALLAQKRSLFTIASFTLFYLGLIFICVTATILAVQQLSDAIRHKFRYKILDHLGMQQKRVDFLILKQFIFYFGFPILLPIPISLFITLSLKPIFAAYLTKSLLLTSINISFGLFLFVYLLYFAATYIGYRKSVMAA
jgi:putative ABC transport system permease protein